MRTLPHVLLLICSLMLGSSPAMADPMVCLKSDALAGVLAKSVREVPSALAIDQAGRQAGCALRRAGGDVDAGADRRRPRWPPHGLHPQHGDGVAAASGAHRGQGVVREIYGNVSDHSPWIT